jgi:hypothetical protein
VGIVPFSVKGWHPGALAAALSAEHGIGVRDGAFCAHPLLDALVAEGDPPAAVRASVGVGTTMTDVDRLIGALADLCARGPQWRYRIERGRYVPDPDPRPRPAPCIEDPRCGRPATRTRDCAVSSRHAQRRRA